MLKNLPLQRPLIFFDLETTGTNIVRDRIVEFGAIKVNPDKSTVKYVRRYNPGIPIEPGATAAHGITDEMVAHEPPFAAFVEELVAFLDNCDLAGYNIQRFDVPLLVEELLRNGASKNPIDTAKFVDCMSIYHKKETRTLTDALRFYANEELNNAHAAIADVEATIKVLNGQLAKYADIAADLNFLHEFSTEGYERIDYAGCFSRDADGDLIFTFGQNRGKKVLENPGMLEWMLPRDFSEHTKHICRKILAGELS